LKDNALWVITIYVKYDLIHHTKDNKSAKELWDTFKTLFGMVNTTQVNQPDTELSNLKMGDFNTIEEYNARFKNLKDDIIQGGKGKTDPELASIALNNLSNIQIFRSFGHSISLLVKDPVTHNLEKVFINLFQHQVTLRNMGEYGYLKFQPLLNLRSIRVKGNTRNPLRRKMSCVAIVIRRATPLSFALLVFKKWKNLQDL
jgi:hypothetical protein